MKTSKILLGTRQKQALYLITSLLWLSGAVWLYLSMEDPSRPLWMKIHGAAAMAFLVIFGTLLVRHVPAAWEQNRERPSGAWLLGMCGTLILTGWGLYYFGNDQIRHWTSLLHGYLGLIFPLLIAFHVWLGRNR
jgi:hypothetical protein